MNAFLNESLTYKTSQISILVSATNFRGIYQHDIQT